MKVADVPTALIWHWQDGKAGIKQGFTQFFEALLMQACQTIVQGLKYPPHRFSLHVRCDVPSLRDSS